MLRSFKAHSDSVGTLAMHGWFLFSGSEDTLIRMWNLVTLSETYELGVLRPPFATSSTGTSSPIVSLDVVPMFGFVVSAAADGTMLVWDYGAFEGNEDFDAYGKIVYRNKYVSVVRNWLLKLVFVDGKLGFLVHTDTRATSSVCATGSRADPLSAAQATARFSSSRSHLA